ncbi:MAG: hypothetical protein V9F03_02005 [Microthrixaceae bacterium]
MPSLLTLSIGYFLSDIGTGLAVKYFTGSMNQGFMGLTSMQYLVYSTAFSSIFCVAIVLIFKWHKRATLTRNEKIVLFLSGACTSFIIPVSTLIISLPISVMIAMVLMRVSVMIASRLIDVVLNFQGLQDKKIPWQENLAVLFAIGAVAAKTFFTPETSYQFSNGAIALLVLYFIAYFIRLYIMNRAKLLGIAGKKLDQKLYFGVEQLFASGVLFVFAIGVFLMKYSFLGSTGKIGFEYVDAILSPHPQWPLAAIAGLPYGFVAIFSVFLFLYPGKSATFTGVTNRLVSLLGGTATSIILYLFFDVAFPPVEDWIALTFILIAIGLLAWGNPKGSFYKNLA